ncbi:hypothetical protein [Streptomyces syringium]
MTSLRMEVPRLPPRRKDQRATFAADAGFARPDRLVTGRHSMIIDYT